MKTLPTPVDQIILPEWLIPMQRAPGSNASDSQIADSDKQLVFTDSGVAICGGKILAVDDRQTLLQNYQAKEVIELPSNVLMPGLVNAHTHAAMTLLRGYADDLPLMEWLSQHIWPAESKWVNREFIQVGTDIAIAEMLRGGTTCFNDMYFFPDETAARAEKSGMRACVGMIVIDFPTVWANDADEYIDKGLEVRDAFRHSPLVTTAFAPHAPYTVSDAPLEKIAMLADELDCQVHIHLHETAHEVEESTARYGMRPLERLDRLGLVNPRLNAVHMTQLLPAEIATVAARSVNIIHCPQSNLKLASGMCPAHEILSSGINLAIGTDGASSNNDLDMLGETQSASLLGKGVSQNPSALNAYQSLYAATMGGAAALALDDVIGSIESGKSADVITIDLSDLSTQPVYHPISQVAYSASRNQVSNVWVAGKRLLQDGQLTTLDCQQLLAQSREWGDKIANGLGE